MAAAHIVHGGPGREVARTKAIGGKSAHELRPAEEAVRQGQLPAAPGRNVAALSAHHSDHVAGDRIIGAKIFGGPQEFHVAAQARQILVEGRNHAGGRAPVVVERIVVDGRADGGNPSRPIERRLLDRKRCFSIGVAARRRVARRAVHQRGAERRALVVDRIAPLHAQLLGQRGAEPECGSVGFAAIGLIVAGQALLGVNVRSDGEPAAVDARLREREIEALGVLSIGHRGADRIAAAQQVPFSDRHFTDHPVGRRIAPHDPEIAGVLLFQLHIDDDPVRRRAGRVGDLDGLEVPEILQPPLGALEQRPVVGVAFPDVELAPDDVVVGLAVAMDIDALDVAAGARLDRVDEMDDVIGLIAIVPRLHHDERITVPGGLDRKLFDRPLHRFGIVDVADAGPQPRVQDHRIQVAQAGPEIDRADPVLVALLDGERDREALLTSVILRPCRHHANIGIAVLQIEAAQMIAVRFDAIGIVDIVVQEEAQEIGLAGLDRALELIGRIGMVAGKLDFLDASLAAFVDLEHQIRLLVPPCDDLGLDARFEIAAAVIDFDHARDVLLDNRAPQRAAALGLDFRLELLVLDLLVPLEGDPLEGRVLDHGDDQLIAGSRDVHIGKQAGGVQRLERGIEVGGFELLAARGMEIRPDRVGLDPLVALDPDRGSRGGLRSREGHREPRHGSAGEQACRDDAAGGQAIGAKA